MTSLIGKWVSDPTEVNILRRNGIWEMEFFENGTVKQKGGLRNHGRFESWGTFTVKGKSLIISVRGMHPSTTNFSIDENGRLIFKRPTIILIRHMK